MNKTVKFVPGAFAGLAAVVALVAGCKQEYPYLRTQEALATMDKVCGVYELVSLEWDGPHYRNGLRARLRSGEERL